MTPTRMRVYEPHELGTDGYPPEWHDFPGPWPGIAAGQPFGIKHMVRAQAGYRCVRCLHPFPPGSSPEWSPCDERCTHHGPGRYRPGWSELGEGVGTSDHPVDPWTEGSAPPGATAGDLIAGGIDVEAAWRVLTVHHLNGRKFDCRWWNLAALCQRCHLQIQGKVQMERVWPWEHSEWFRPYAAGWYAYAYEGADLTRAEVEADLDRLLALERAA